MFHPLEVAPQHQRGNPFTALFLYRYRCRNIGRDWGRRSEEWGVILCSVLEEVEGLGLVVMKGVSIAGEDVAASLECHQLSLRLL